MLEQNERMAQENDQNLEQSIDKVCDEGALTLAYGFGARRTPDVRVTSAIASRYNQVLEPCP
jgi:hypothetical protein